MVFCKFQILIITENLKVYTFKLSIYFKAVFNTFINKLTKILTFIVLKNKTFIYIHNLCNNKALFQFYWESLKPIKKIELYQKQKKPANDTKCDREKFIINYLCIYKYCEKPSVKRTLKTTF